MCPRCDGTRGAARSCNSCTRLFYQPEKTERALRAGRIEALRDHSRRVESLQTALSLIVPGAAGWIAQRPLRGYIGTLAFSLAAATLLGWRGRVPDPGVAGMAGPLAFLCLALACCLIYFATVATSRTVEQES